MKKINRYTYLSVVMILLGVLLAIYANATTYVQADSVLHETFATPLSVFFVVFGVLTFLASLLIKSNKNTKN